MVELGHREDRRKYRIVLSAGKIFESHDSLRKEQCK